MKGLWKHRVVGGIMAVSLLFGAAAANADYYQDRSRYQHDDYRWQKEHRKHGDDYGRVLEVDPIFARSAHRCEDRYRFDKRYKDSRDGERTRAIVGGIAGATIGNLIGREHGDAALGTAIGAAIGAVGATALDNDRRSSKGYSDCARHDNLKYDRRPVAYRVTYLYRGQVRVMETREHPGRYVRIGGQGKRG